MGKRFEDWLRQAESDLSHAKKSIEIGDYDWACFASHQSAEKALKALYDSLSGEGWGHSVRKLLKELPFNADRGLIRKGAYLDKMYIPSRYPNGFESGAPVDYFDDKDAREAVIYAEDIFSFVKTKIRK